MPAATKRGIVETPRLIKQLSWIAESSNGVHPGKSPKAQGIYLHRDHDEDQRKFLELALRSHLCALAGYRRFPVDLPRSSSNFRFDAGVLADQHCRVDSLRGGRFQGFDHSTAS